MSRGGGPADSVIAVGLPPGWIELAAFERRDEVASFVTDHLAAEAASGSAADAGQRRSIVDACLRAHDLLAGQRWLHCGAVMTSLPLAGGDEGQVTVWAVGTGLLPVPATGGDIDPLAVAERALGRLGTADAIEPFTLDDGRSGFVVGTSVAIPAHDGGGGLPQTDPDALGVYLCVLPITGLPGHVALTVGVAPTKDERGPMSVLAGQMACSIHLLSSGESIPRELVLIDRTHR